MNGPGQLACFNPVTESYEDIPPHNPATKNSHLTDVVEGPDGRLYMPGFPSGDCVAYDRDTGEYGKSRSRRETTSFSPPVSPTADTLAF